MLHHIACRFDAFYGTFLPPIELVITSPRYKPNVWNLKKEDSFARSVHLRISSGLILPVSPAQIQGWTPRKNLNGIQNWNTPCCRRWFSFFQISSGSSLWNFSVCPSTFGWFFATLRIRISLRFIFIYWGFWYTLGCPPSQDASHHEDFFSFLGSGIPN